jgi:hypothetical protein
MADVDVNRAAKLNKASMLEDAHACLKDLMADRSEELTTLHGSLDADDQRALDDLARVVYALRQAIEVGQFEKALRAALAALVESAKGVPAKAGHRHLSGNIHYQKFGEFLKNCMKADGVVDIVFDRAKERGDAAAEHLVSASLGGQLQGDLRQDGIVNRHAGDAQLRLARNNFRNALCSPSPANVVFMIGSGLKLLAMTDELLNRISPPPTMQPESGDWPDGAGTVPMSPGPDVSRTPDASFASEADQAEQGSGDLTIGDADGLFDAIDQPISALQESLERLDVRDRSGGEPARDALELGQERIVDDSLPTQRRRKRSVGQQESVTEGGERNGVWEQGVDGKWRMNRETSVVSTTERVWSADVLRRARGSSSEMNEASIDEFESRT